LKAVGTFGEGAGQLATASDKLYASILDTDKQLAALAVTLPKDTFEKAVGGQNLRSEVRRHKAAIASLAAYASTLKDFATYNQDSEIEGASKDLSSSLSGLAKTLDKTASVDESALATALTSVAQLYFSLKQRAVVRQTVREA